MFNCGPCFDLADLRAVLCCLIILASLSNSSDFRYARAGVLYLCYCFLVFLRLLLQLCYLFLLSVSAYLPPLWKYLTQQPLLKLSNRLALFPGGSRRMLVFVFLYYTVSHHAPSNSYSASPVCLADFHNILNAAFALSTTLPSLSLV